MPQADLIVRGGTIFDGGGGEPFEGDVAIAGGRIVAVGKADMTATEEIDARGCVVMPGFVDIHTHYDGQVTWEQTTSPSSNHGVTTVVMGNCGVGFAPCRADDRDKLIRLMEGVEDVPEVVMANGLPWNWETFPEYLDRIEAREGDVDIAAQLPHSCLRIYVMGSRGANLEVATEDDLAQMSALAEEAMRAGALGFGTSRTLFHQDRDGNAIPTKNANSDELDAIAAGMARAGSGVLQAVIDSDDMPGTIAFLKGVAQRSGRPISYSLAQLLDHPNAWRTALDLTAQANAEGVEMKAQVIGRPTGLMMGLDLSFNPFSLIPAYQAIAHLPLADRVNAMRDPVLKQRILTETPADPHYPALAYMRRFESTYALGNPPNYEPAPDQSIGARARELGVAPLELLYDEILKDDGHAILFVTIANYADGTLDAVEQMLQDPNTILGLGDGGAHYGMICDASVPTFMLTHWTRDRIGTRLSIAEVVRRLTSSPAEAVRLNDRGRIGVGYKADLNVIDFDKLKLRAPHVIYDLPGGGRRLAQDADGYRATIVSGVTTYRDGVDTGARPGRLVRGPQPAPG